MPGPVPLAVVLCLIEDAGRILLLRRNKPPYQGYLALPGGKLHAGETISQAACREAQEETGLVTEVLGMLPVLTESIAREPAQDHAGPEMNTVEAHFVLFPVWLRVCSGSLQSGPEGELCWVDLKRASASASAAGDGRDAAAVADIVETDRVLIAALFEAMRRGQCWPEVCHMDVGRNGDVFCLLNPDAYRRGLSEC